MYNRELDGLNQTKNAQMILTVDQRGRLVYQDGAPALLEASLRRLQNVLKGQVVHCDVTAHKACEAFATNVHILDQNGSHVDDISKAYRETNYQQERETNHYMVDYEGSLISARGVNASPMQTGFFSRLHIAQYFDTAPGPHTSLGHPATLSELELASNGYVLESAAYETFPYRAGGPTCAKIRHLVWRHVSADRTAIPVFSVDDSARAMAFAGHHKVDNFQRRSTSYIDEYDGISVQERIRINQGLEARRFG